MATGIRRRTFLVGAAAGAATVALAYWRLRPVERGAPAAVSVTTTSAPPEFGDCRDVYRERWTGELTGADGAPLQPAVIYLPDNGRGDRNTG